MTDVVKMCDVIDNCEDCPKYGDDCDGDKMTEHTDLISRADALRELNGACSNWQDDAKVAEIINALPSADAVPLKQTDTLIIADALRYLAKDAERHLSDRTRADALREQFLKYGASMCHSADPVQGEWIRKVKECNDCDGHCAVYWHECSVCGARPLYTRFVNEKLTNYCPNCGARMTPYKGGDTE